MTMWDAPGTMPVPDQAKPIAVLAGVHARCYERSQMIAWELSGTSKESACDLCFWWWGPYIGVEQERVGRFLVAKGYEHDMGLGVLKSLPYLRWRDSNPETTSRFHTVRFA